MPILQHNELQTIAPGRSIWLSKSVGSCFFLYDKLLRNRVNRRLPAITGKQLAKQPVLCKDLSLGASNRLKYIVTFNYVNQLCYKLVHFMFLIVLSNKLIPSYQNIKIFHNIFLMLYVTLRDWMHCGDIQGIVGYALSSTLFRMFFSLGKHDVSVALRTLQTRTAISTCHGMY